MTPRPSTPPGPTRPDPTRPDPTRPRPDATPADAAPPDAAPDADPADPADLGCPAYADAGAPEPAIAAADLRRGSPAEQGCRLDRLFVDAPAEGPSPGPAFGDGLARRLSRLEPGWFCAAGDGGCLAEVGADIEQGRFAHAAPLIPPGTPHAGDAPERFHRLSFRRPVRPEALPDVVGAVRRWADEAVAGQLTFLVGRECVAIALGTEPRATPALREAVVRRIGLAPTPPATPWAEAAEVALVDTGLEAVVADELGADAVPLPGGDLAGPLHPHGTAMGLLVRQVTPRARLHDVRVLGTPGHGDIGDVARGIIAALGIADMDRRRALVLNLSLGWPPELGQRRVLRDAAGDAAGFEDPVGESVRFALLLAAREEGPGRPIVVVAAAGNRPGRPEANRLVYNSFFDVEPGATPATRCPGGAPGGPYLFFPAAWSQVPTCAEGDDPRWLATAIGGLSDADAPATLAILGAEPPLVAPAEHAYVASARAPASLDTFQCDAPPDVAGFTSPTALTGTSVAAALTSGVVVRLIAARRDAGLAVPDAARLLVLATAAGRRLERGVHALDACRADAAVACAPAACVDADLGAGLPAAVDACAAALAACPALDACPPPPAPPPLPDGFTVPTDEACLCHRAPGTPTRAADCATADTLCPYEVEPRHPLPRRRRPPARAPELPRVHRDGRAAREEGLALPGAGEKAEWRRAVPGRLGGLHPQRRQELAPPRGHDAPGELGRRPGRADRGPGPRRRRPARLRGLLHGGSGDHPAGADGHWPRSRCPCGSRGCRLGRSDGSAAWPDGPSPSGTSTGISPSSTRCSRGCRRWTPTTPSSSWATTWIGAPTRPGSSGG
ncbi:MAG: S8/S53 family peptidase [bacterium]